MSIVYLNGQMMNAEEAMVSVYDHGFLYGLGLFETFRTYGGHCFLLERHMKRLLESCDQLGIQLRMNAADVQQAVGELLQLNKLEDGYVRLTVSGGMGELGLPSEDYDQATVVIMVKPLGAMSEEVWNTGKALQLLQTRRNTPEGRYRFKSLHYMNNILAKRELLSLGTRTAAGAEGLMLSEKGILAEGIVSNLFFVQDGVIYTPHIDTGILPGITRQYVIELARHLSYEVREGHYDFEALWNSSEAWMTNSIQELVPVTTLITTAGEKQQLSGGEAGPICRQLTAAYRASIDKQIES
ncbi:aminodeoxychorismate lyase [Paenibacillus camelliae]|nr:aminodeoxychorismate lyase [Paenibacillus camelliae]MCM3635858.1 aminodeoxychorismate lyase [Paenibacillus camelliae]